MSSKIPTFVPATFEDMVRWFAALDSADLIYHPDDSAHEMVFIRSGERMFTDEEARQLDETMGHMFERFGDRVYEAAYPFFMRRMHPGWPYKAEAQG